MDGPRRENLDPDIGRKWWEIPPTFVIRGISCPLLSSVKASPEFVPHQPDRFIKMIKNTVVMDNKNLCFKNDFVFIGFLSGFP